MDNWPALFKDGYSATQPRPSLSCPPEEIPHMTFPERFRLTRDDKRGLCDRTAGFVRARRARKEKGTLGLQCFNKWVDSDPRSLLLGNTVKLSRCDMHRA